MIFAPKKIDFGFIILSTEHNYAYLKSTVSSIKRNYSDIEHICVADKSINKDVLKEFNTIVPAYKGRETIPSLLNIGLKKTKAEWNFFIFEGTIVRKNLELKMSRFIDNEKEVLFPLTIDYDKGKICNVNTNFPDATLNGVLIHKNAIKEVGEFSNNPLDISKLMWSLDAIAKGYKFKGILGTKMV